METITITMTTEQRAALELLKAEIKVSNVAWVSVPLGMTEKVYIAGKISGLNPMVAFHRFSFAEFFLAERYKVENPMRFCPRYWGWFRCIVKCIFRLARCQKIYLLDNWEQSKGAKIEVLFAILMNKKIIKEG
ncbi:MAG: DUF4406 domain-containing protein [Bacteroidales bacterium]